VRLRELVRDCLRVKIELRPNPATLMILSPGNDVEGSVGEEIIETRQWGWVYVLHTNHGSWFEHSITGGAVSPYSAFKRPQWGRNATKGSDSGTEKEKLEKIRRQN
jgi:hypothetical protein